MKKRLQEIWNEAWEITSEMTDLIRYASEGRTKHGDANRLDTLLTSYVKLIKEANNLINEDDSCSCAEKDSQSSHQRS